MHKLIGAASRRGAGMAAGVVLAGGLVGGVLLAPGTAYASTTNTATAITSATQTATSSGTTLAVDFSVTAFGSPTSPTGSVSVSGAGGGCSATLDAAGAGSCSISGLSAGSYTLTANYGGAAGFAGSWSRPYSVRIGGGPVFTTPVFVAHSPSLSATAGQSYSYTFRAVGSPGISYSLSGPGWLHIDSYNGAVWGTVPSYGGSFTYSVTATNSAGSATAGPYTVWVARPQHNRGNVRVTTYLSCTSKVYTGQRGTCTLWVTNRGYNSASNVNAQIALPSQLRADYCNYGYYYWNYGCSISNNTASENLGTLSPGQTKSLTVVFTAKSGFSLFGWRHGWRFTVQVVGSASSNSNNWYWWFYGQRSSTSVAYVTIIPRGIWW
jgi:Bacterial Ig-like domain (group 3)/Domain of unknown function DUF11